MGWLVSLGLMAVAIGACGGGSGPGPAADDDASSTVAAATTTAAAATTAEDAATTTTLAPSSTTERVDEPPPKVVLVAPPGWAATPDGLVIAESDSDLVGLDPTGPRVIDITSTGMSAYVRDVDEAGDLNVEMIGELRELTIGELPAVAVSLVEQTPSGASLVSTTVVVDTGDGWAHVFLLQTPRATYEAAEPLLLEALQPAP
jgi:hypothetical protein